MISSGVIRGRAKALAERLIDWMAAGYQLQYRPSGDVAVFVEPPDGVPRDRIIYTVPPARPGSPD